MQHLLKDGEETLYMGLLQRLGPSHQVDLHGWKLQLREQLDQVLRQDTGQHRPPMPRFTDSSWAANELTLSCARSRPAALAARICGSMSSGGSRAILSTVAGVTSGQRLRYPASAKTP